eukprot:2091993-Alexandrium_andersonii.AAC.1
MLLRLATTGGAGREQSLEAPCARPEFRDIKRLPFAPRPGGKCAWKRRRRIRRQACTGCWGHRSTASAMQRRPRR